MASALIDDELVWCDQNKSFVWNNNKINVQNGNSNNGKTDQRDTKRVKHSDSGKLELKASSTSHDSGSDKDSIDIEIDSEHEKTLRKQLGVYMEELNRCNSETLGMTPRDRKKIRNRKASRVSRLKKKLYVYDLQRNYNAAILDRARKAQLISRIVSSFAIFRKYVDDPKAEACNSLSHIPVVDSHAKYSSTLKCNAKSMKKTHKPAHTLTKDISNADIEAFKLLVTTITNRVPLSTEIINSMDSSGREHCSEEILSNINQVLQNSSNHTTTQVSSPRSASGVNEELVISQQSADAAVQGDLGLAQYLLSVQDPILFNNVENTPEMTCDNLHQSFCS